jgi:butyryl-CoA dehydrogenase
MDFALTEEQRMVQATAREFARERIAPEAAAIDREHRHPAALVAAMGELGLMGITVSEPDGGAGLDHVTYVLAVEEIAVACASTAAVMSVNNSLVCDPIGRFGTPDQRARFLPHLARAAHLGCFALSEPEAGSDAAAQRTTATAQPDGSWVLNGTKNWITNGPVADVAVIFAMNDRSAGTRGITAFIVPMDTPGVTAGAPDDKLGIRGTQSSQIVLDEVQLGADAVLGQVGSGFKVAMSTLDGGRIGIAAQAVGIARACLEASLEYAKQRTSFGKAIIDHQAVAFKLADMAAAIDAARLLTLRAAWLKDNALPYGRAAATAKLVASEAANDAARDAIQVFGGNGYVTENPVERHFRDAKITEIYEGTSEIQRIVIAASLVRDGVLS